jgi:hypothetical protein
MMRRLRALALVLAFTPVVAHAGWFEDDEPADAPASGPIIKTSGSFRIDQERRQAGVYVDFTHSARTTATVRESLQRNGYVLVERQDQARVLLIVSGDVTIKGQGKSDLGRFLEGGAVFRQPGIGEVSGAWRDGGVINESSKLTGGFWSGWALAALSGFVMDATGATKAINTAHYKAGEHDRVDMLVYAKDKDSGGEQRMTLTASSEEVPRLIDTAMTRIMDVLVK